MFRSRLKLLRENRGLSQAELGEYLNLTQQTINNYEKGKREPSQDTLQKIANFFNTSTDYLLGRTDDPTPPQAKQEKPNHEQYILSAPALPDALLRIAEVQAVYNIDDATFIELSKKAIEKFGAPKPMSGLGAAAAHVTNSIPGTGVFEVKK